MNQLLLCASTCHHIRIIWVSHGPKNIVCSISFLHPRCLTSLLDAKEIIAFNLVRLGLARANGPGIFHSAKFSVSWSLLSQRDLDLFHEDLTQDLRDVPYGPFLALNRLVGLQLAQRISRRGEVIECPLVKRPADAVVQGEHSKWFRG